MRSALAVARDLAAACRQGPVAFQIQAAHLAREAEDLVALLDEPGKKGLPLPEVPHVVDLAIDGRWEKRRFTSAIAALAHMQRAVGIPRAVTTSDDVDDATGEVMYVTIDVEGEHRRARFTASPEEMAMARAVVGI